MRKRTVLMMGLLLLVIVGAAAIQFLILTGTS